MVPSHYLKQCWLTNNEVRRKSFHGNIHLNGPLARYVKLRVAHASRMPGTCSPPPRVSDPDMHHGTCVTHVPWCMPGSLTSGFLWSQWREKHSRHSRRMRNSQFYVSGKRPIPKIWISCLKFTHLKSQPHLPQDHELKQYQYNFAEKCNLVTRSTPAAQTCVTPSLRNV